jgi:hypothetical protein
MIKLLEVNRKLRGLSPSIYKMQLEKESLLLQEETGRENMRKLRLEAKNNLELTTLLKIGELNN